MGELLVVMALLQLKHLVVDWCWQPEYEWRNKGTYGHWGGIQHSIKNALGTALCFAPFVAFSTVCWVFVVDYLVHYHVDWAKMNINQVMGWGPTTHAEFWMLTGLDQYCHQITYVLLLCFVFL